jgi:hypothetical protein
LTLGIGETVHLVLRWKSASVDGSQCQEAGGFNTESYLVVAPSLISNVCSVVKVDSYLPGPFIKDSEVLDQASRMKVSTVVRLEPSDSLFMQGIPFHFWSRLMTPADNCQPITPLALSRSSGRALRKAPAHSSKSVPMQSVRLLLPPMAAVV